MNKYTLFLGSGAFFVGTIICVLCDLEGLAENYLTTGFLLAFLGVSVK